MSLVIALFNILAADLTTHHAMHCILVNPYVPFCFVNLSTFITADFVTFVTMMLIHVIAKSIFVEGFATKLTNFSLGILHTSVFIIVHFHMAAQTRTGPKRFGTMRAFE